MKFQTSLFVLLFATSGLWLFMQHPVLAQEKTVRAKIGIQIQSNGVTLKAKSKDQLSPGDLLRVYVSTDENFYVYVVHSDLSAASLLNTVENKGQNSLLVMPSAQDFYQVDGKSDQEIFTVICSPTEIYQMTDFVKKDSIPQMKWAEIEKALMQQGKIELSENTDKPFALAGNVRGIGGSNGADPFETALPIFSGKGLLVKKYEFSLKK